MSEVRSGTLSGTPTETLMFREGCELRLRHIYMGTQRGRLCNVEMTELRGPRVKLGILCGLEFGFVHVKKKKIGLPWWRSG